MDDFAMRLRFAIERSGMQQKKLATALKLSPARLSNYVNGHSEPSLDVLLLICKELKVSADYMIGLTDNINGSTSVPVSVPNAHVFRDPFGDLTPDQRAAIETTLKAFRDHNAATAKEA